MSENWKYYNHALIPNTEPHIICIPPRDKRTFWKQGGCTIHHSLLDGLRIGIVEKKQAGGM